MSVPAVEDLSLRQKVGQLFVVGFEGTALPRRVGRLVDEWGLGGVIYFSRNVETPSQTRALSDRLQSRAEAAGVPPLFVAIDQEGGPVSRLRWGTTLPSAMALGATRDEALARAAGEAVGAELRSLGVNVDFAPVLDVNNNPSNPVIGVRSFGEDPALVGALGSRVAAGIQERDLVACGKHFPGHGDTDVDSHSELPVFPHDRARLDRTELPPFEAAIDAGVDAIMTTHVAFPALTGSETRPATVSEAVVTGLLRDDLGFDGLAVTDCLEMDAIADGVGTTEAAVQAIAAGCDLLTVSHSPDAQDAAMRAVYDAVRSGRLSEARLDETVSRVLEAKRDRAVGTRGSTTWEAAADRSRAVAGDVAAAAVTLVRNRDGTLPVGERVTVVTFAGDGRTSAADRDAGPVDLAAAVESADCAVERRSAEGGVPVVDEDATVVVGTLGAVDDESQAEVVCDLRRRVDDLAVVALQSPYDLAAFPDVDCYLTAYDRTPASLDAVGAVLRGDAEPRGTLPVTIPTDDGVPGE